MPITISGDTPNFSAATITALTSTTGTVTTLTTTTISDGTNSTSATNPIRGSAKAWVNWDGLNSPYTTIRSSFNVSSITYVSGAIYRVNFTTAMADANYVTVIGGNAYFKLGTSQTTAYTQVQTQNSSSSDQGYLTDQVAVFGN
jgi:hypothetical protein